MVTVDDANATGNRRGVCGLVPGAAAMAGASANLLAPECTLATRLAPVARSRTGAHCRECGAPQHVIMVMDPVVADAQLAASAISCSTCSLPLAPWGYSRERSVRGPDGPLRVRPRRARCRSCRTTHVLLPAQLVPRRSATVEVIGAVLLASAHGVGRRAIAADLNLPTDTVRGWIRRATANIGFLRYQGRINVHNFCAEQGPFVPHRSALAEAINDLGSAAAAAVRYFGPIGPPWRIICAITSGQLLAPHPKPA